MIENVTMRKWGKSLMFISFVLWIIEFLTHFFSEWIGQMICGEEYLCPVDGIVCDKSCGFNTDMYLFWLLVTLMLLGVLLYHRSRKAIFPVDIKNAEANE